MNSTETKENESSENGAIIQADVDEQIMSFIAPLKRQLEVLTRFVQGMATASRPN